MSASMAEVLAEHWEFDIETDRPSHNVFRCECDAVLDLPDDYGSVEAAHQAHVAEQLAANGYGKLEDAWEQGAYAYETRRARDESLPLTNPYRSPE